jgi:phosphopantetheine adenylyltransferase
MALIQIELGSDDTTELEYQKGVSLFETKIAEVKDLMMNKNHDYGEAWREMRVSSMTDLILMKLKRIKQIEDNHGATLMSEGVDANYQDIINYAAFALIKLDESK